VIELRRAERTQGIALAASISIGIHAALWFWALHAAHTRDTSPASTVVLLEAIAAQELPVDLSEPPPPPEIPTAAEPPREQPVRRRQSAGSRSQPRSQPSAAEPGASTERVPAPTAPLDFTDETFVMETARAEPGAPTARGTGQGDGLDTPGASTGAEEDSVKDLSRNVSLENQRWACPWPREADAEQLDEQTVVIRVVVDALGIVDSVTVIADPGRGFGQAAAGCAMRTRFTPARDRLGQPVKAKSPLIRVKFTR
jgi:periplasmic protein TonB